MRRPTRAADGCNWKKRWHYKLDDILEQVIRTKSDDPTPVDLIKSAATKSGMIVDYNTAYRVVCGDKNVQTRESIKNYEMMIPYLEARKKSNPSSVIGNTRDDGMRLLDLYVFSGFMNRVLNYTRPVVLLDAAHLRSAHKGTLYVASVLSGNNDVFPIWFMICSGNEDRDNWHKMLTNSKEACSLIAEQGNESIANSDGVEKRMFLFVSDRDQGLKPAPRDVFPNNHKMSCAKHIKANVSKKYGKQCGRYVIAIAKSFSTRHLSELLDTIWAIKATAATYLEDITRSGILWQSTQWLNPNPYLPPQYGIVTSNTSESVNNMFAEARNLGWPEALERILDIMSSRIKACRSKYQQREEGDVVPRVAQILKKRWDAAASLSVDEIELGCGDYKVVERASVADDLFENSQATSPQRGRRVVSTL